MLTLGARLTHILAELRATIGAFMGRRDHAAVVWLGTQAYVPVQAPSATPPVPTETWALAHTRLGRMAQRLARLFERWQSNTLPKPRPPRPAASPPAAPRPPTCSS